MASNTVMNAGSAAIRRVATTNRVAATKRVAASSAARSFASAAPVAAAGRDHKIVVVGGGTGGMAISHQLLASGQFAPHDIAVVDPASWHHYQPGWTLVGGGVKNKQDLRSPLAGLLDSKLKHYAEPVDTFTPEDNALTLGNGDKLRYEQLVMAPGININFGSVAGLNEALANPKARVSSSYSYDTCDRVHDDITAFKQGRAIFTQPAGVIKCAGGPQKVMWLALDAWRKAGLYNPSNPSASPIQISFATGLPVMFGVPKYNAKLEELRQQRGVEGLFQHDLTSIDGNNATFTRPDGQAEVKRRFDMLHVVPKMGPHAFVSRSPLANATGFVDVDAGSLRHTKYGNVWSAGDASSLPTSKTAAAITSQSPVLVRNLLQTRAAKTPDAVYDGYTSCPLTTEYGKVLLAEFKYGGEPKETFGRWLGVDQIEPRKMFWHLKKDFFPWVYFQSLVKGTWGGPSAWSVGAGK